MNTLTDTLPAAAQIRGDNYNLLQDCAPTHALVEFICGTTSDRFGKLMDWTYVESAQSDVENMLTAQFSGFSRHTIHGGWRSPSGEYVRDKSFVFSCIVPLDVRRSLLEEIRLRMQAAFLQESVPMVVRPCYAQF